MIIPTYNRAALTGNAIDSVLKQETSADEISVVDDGPGDSTTERLVSHGNLICVIHQPNAGPSAARNWGIREATSDLITFQNSDDIWEPNKITRQLDYLNQHPKVGLLFSDFEETRDGSIVRPSVVSVSICSDYLRANHSNLSKLFNYLLTCNPVISQSVIMRRSLVKQIGYFNESLYSVEDRKYWLRRGNPGSDGIFTQPEPLESQLWCWYWWCEVQLTNPRQQFPGGHIQNPSSTQGGPQTDFAVFIVIISYNANLPGIWTTQVALQH